MTTARIRDSMNVMTVTVCKNAIYSVTVRMSLVCLVPV
jgi:hypothetical protein